MSNPDYRTAAYIALDGIAARAEVNGPEPIKEIPPEKLLRYMTRIENLVRDMIGDAFFRILQAHEDWNISLRIMIRQMYLDGVSDGASGYERYLTDQAKAQMRGMFSGLLRASEEG